jgi:hypothetical protein
MKFPYSSVITAAPGSSDFYLIRRPEIPVTICGPSGRMTLIGLVDTGSDNTIFPKSVADQLNIATSATAVPTATAFGGQRIEMRTGDVVLMLEPKDEPAFGWPTTVSFFDFASPGDEAVVLGHAGFLEFFTAIFDSSGTELTLIANDDSAAE